MFNALKKVLRILGPGIIPGASDDDPSGILLFTAIIITLEIFFVLQSLRTRAQMADALPTGLSLHGFHRGRALADDLAGDLSAPHRIQFPIPLHYYGCAGDDHFSLHVFLAGVRGLRAGTWMAGFWSRQASPVRTFAQWSNPCSARGHC